MWVPHLVPGEREKGGVEGGCVCACMRMRV